MVMGGMLLATRAAAMVPPLPAVVTHVAENVAWMPGMIPAVMRHSSMSMVGVVVTVVFTVVSTLALISLSRGQAQGDDAHCQKK
jgi:hypothetical protein